MNGGGEVIHLLQLIARLSNQGFAGKLTIEALGIAKVFNFFTYLQVLLKADRQYLSHGCGFLALRRPENVAAAAS